MILKLKLWDALTIHLGLEPKYHLWYNSTIVLVFIKIQIHDLSIALILVLIKL